MLPLSEFRNWTNPASQIRNPKSQIGPAVQSNISDFGFEMQDSSNFEIPHSHTNHAHRTKCCESLSLSWHKYSVISPPGLPSQFVYVPRPAPGPKHLGPGQESAHGKIPMAASSTPGSLAGHSNGIALKPISCLGNGVVAANDANGRSKESYAPVRVIRVIRGYDPVFHSK